jgi:hypothetical protein
VPSTMPSIGASGSMSSRALSTALASSVAPQRGLCGSSPIATAQIVAPRSHVGAERPVYNLSVADGHLPEFYANGILTHNCLMTAAGFEGEGSPDRVDAMVWAFTELFPRLTQRVRPLGSGLPPRANNSYSPHAWRR